MATITCLHQGTPNFPAIVFVHGLGGHPIDTWRHGDCKADDCWPHWVGVDTDHEIWTLAYDGALSAWREEAMPLPDQGMQVANLLAHHPQLQGRELVLIGHSMGGLVIKTAIADGGASDDAALGALPGRIRAVVFASTPHRGANLADLAVAARFVLRTNEQLGDMCKHEAHLVSLNTRFRKAAQFHGMAVKVFAERHRVTWKIWGGLRTAGVLVVDSASADPGISGVVPSPLAEHHFSIVKPANRNAQIHIELLSFLKNLPRPALPSAAVVEPLAATTTTAACPARLRSAQDNRLQPIDGRLLGRQGEIAQLLSFLQGNDDAMHVTAREVSGVGGIGKTELCKAALKAWLTEAPHATAYFFVLPDHAGVNTLLATLAQGLALDQVGDWPTLQASLPQGLYYLDNLEGLAQDPEGQRLLGALRDTPGVRVLASTRVLLDVLGRPLRLDVLDQPDALALFRARWTGKPTEVADEAALAAFVIDELGAHTLSVVLVARLGDVFGFAGLVSKWSSYGTSMAGNPVAPGAHRSNSLVRSLRLTAGVLGGHPGTLDLWCACAVFANGPLDDADLDRLQQGLANTAYALAGQEALVRHHVLAREGVSGFVMLPPLARYALECGLRDADGFSWRRVQAPVRALLDAVLPVAASVRSDEEVLSAQRWVVTHFRAIETAMRQEIEHPQPDLAWVRATHQCMNNLYQHVALRARDLLALLNATMPNEASALKKQGDLESRLGEVDKARALFDQALELFKKQRDGLGQANTLKALGDLESRLGEVGEARALYDQALAFYKKESAGLGQANTLKALGDLESRLGEVDKARALYDQALALFKKQSDGLGQANTLRALGDLESRLGEVDKARALYDQALALFKKESDGLGQANTLQALGDLALKKGQFQDALVRYELALTLYQREQEPMGTAYSLAEMARCLHALDDGETADARILTALRASEGAGGENVRRYVLGVLVEITGSREAAQAWLASHSGDTA